MEFKITLISHTLQNWEVPGYGLTQQNRTSGDNDGEGENHRMTECFGLERTFRGHLAQPPCSEQGHLQLDQGAQSPVQPGLECSQGWGIDHLCGQPGPGFHHPQHKKCLPYVQSESPLS